MDIQAHNLTYTANIFKRIKSRARSAMTFFLVAILGAGYLRFNTLLTDENSK